MQHSLFSKLSPYKGLDSAKPDNLPVANKTTEQVICLPIYPDLDLEKVKIISIDVFIEHGIVERINNHYELSDPIFKCFINKNL